MIKPATAGFVLAVALVLVLVVLWSLLGPPVSLESREHGVLEKSSGGASRGTVGGEIAESAGDSSSLRERLEPREAPSTVKTEAEPQPAREDAGEGALDPFLVLGEDRTPVAKAVLSVYRASYGTPRMRIETGVDGKAMLRALEPGDEIGVKAKGFLPKRIGLPARPWPRPYVVVLDKGTLLCRGQVMDDLDRPVPGALVSGYYEGGEARDETDGEGNFVLRVRRLPDAPLKMRFRIRVPGFCYLGDGCPVEIPEIPGKLGLRVHRWASLRVEVSDPEGKPLVGASLQLGGPPEYPDRWSIPGEWDVAALSMAGPGRSENREADPAGDAGRYLLDQVPPLIPLYLRASHPAYADEEMEVGKLEPGEKRSIVLRFREKRAVWVFHVKDRDGADVPSVDAWVSWHEEKQSSTSRVEVDGRGVFRVDPPDQEWELLVKAEGYFPYRRVFPSTLVPSGEEETIVLEKGGGVIEVQVVDGGGRPVPGIAIFLEDEVASGSSLNGQTDDRGEVRFTGLDPTDAYTVKFDCARPGAFFYLSHSTTRKEVPDPPAYRGVHPGDGVRVFRLVPPGTIQGTVRMDAAKMKGKQLSLSFVDEQGGKHPQVFSVTKSLDENGTFFFTGLPPGHYFLWMRGVEGGGDLHHPMKEVDLHAGETIGPLEVFPR